MKFLFFIIFILSFLSSYSQTVRIEGDFYVHSLNVIEIQSNDEFNLYGGVAHDSLTSYLYLEPQKADLYGDSSYNGGAYLSLRKDTVLLSNRRKDVPDAPYLKMVNGLTELYGGGNTYIALQPGSWTLTNQFHNILVNQASDPDNILIDFPKVTLSNIDTSSQDNLVISISNGVLKKSMLHTPIITDLSVQSGGGDIVTIAVPNDAINHHYLIGGNLCITSIISDTIDFKISFVDINNNPQTIIVGSGFNTSGYKSIPTVDILSYPNTSIVIFTRTRGGTISFYPSAIITQLN